PDQQRQVLQLPATQVGEVAEVDAPDDEKDQIVAEHEQGGQDGKPRRRHAGADTHACQRQQIVERGSESHATSHQRPRSAKLPDAARSTNMVATIISINQAACWPMAAAIDSESSLRASDPGANSIAANGPGAATVRSGAG